MASKTPVLRAGITVDDLLAGTWMAKERRYSSEDEMVELTDEILRVALQGLIDHANGGGRVTRRKVTNTLCAAASMLKAMKDHICDGLSDGKFTPGILDEIAGA